MRHCFGKPRRPAGALAIGIVLGVLGLTLAAAPARAHDRHGRLGHHVFVQRVDPFFVPRRQSVFVVHRRRPIFFAHRRRPVFFAHRRRRVFLREAPVFVQEEPIIIREAPVIAHHGHHEDDDD